MSACPSVCNEVFSETAHQICLKLYQNKYNYSHLKVTILDFCKKIDFFFYKSDFCPKNVFFHFFRNCTLDFFKTSPKHIHLLPRENDGFWFLLKNHFVRMSYFCPKKSFFFINRTLYFFKTSPKHIHLLPLENDGFWFLLEIHFLRMWFLSQKLAFFNFSETLHHISLKLLSKHIYLYSLLKMMVFDFCKKV